MQHLFESRTTNIDGDVSMVCKKQHIAQRDNFQFKNMLIDPEAMQIHLIHQELFHWFHHKAQRPVPVTCPIDKSKVYGYGNECEKCNALQRIEMIPKDNPSNPCKEPVTHHLNASCLITLQRKRFLRRCFRHLFARKSFRPLRLSLFLDQYTGQ